MTRALVALGSNVPPRRATLRAALADLGRLPGTALLAASTLRETEPEDCPPGSGPFLNGACLLETSLAPRDLLAALLEIEARHGRDRIARPERHAPRTLDLDLLLHGDAVLREPGLRLPHPHAHERLFVLEPAAEIAPGMRHPLLGSTLAALLDAARRAGGSPRSCAS